MRVLIVEDETLVAMVLEDLVTEFGHEVCAKAICAAEAVSSAATQQPDVALMDIRLAHGSSGIDAARELYNRLGVRCIFISGSLDPATRSAASAFDPIAFLGKPVMPFALRNALYDAAPGSV